jgi:hypothetical protein
MKLPKIGFVNQHIERIDQLELIQREMWKNYGFEKSPLKMVVILGKDSIDTAVPVSIL